MKLISWNVNGIRAVLNKGFLNFIETEKPDILCIQETKAQSEQVQLNAAGYEQYWNSAEKKGYSGTLVFSKIKPLSFEKGIGIKELDSEGRVITLEFDNFFLINVYTPNSQRGLTRLEYRKTWDKHFLNYILKLEKKKPVIFCGDLNCAHKEIDLARPKDNRRNAGFTDEERTGVSEYIEKGYIDTFRMFDSSPEKYTWWSYMFNARAKNIGWRIDYFFVSNKIKKKVKGAFILNDVMGSDHCPVGMEIEN